MSWWTRTACSSRNAAQGSRKDMRDAVVAARKAQPRWAGATAYNRGQVLYRVAEMLDGRRSQFAEEVASSEGTSRAQAVASVDAAVDRWVWYAGWADKVAQVAGSSNPVAGPFFNFSVPEPTGVVGLVAPQASSLLGLVSVLAPVLVTGNTAVVIASEARPLPAITLAEVLATSDLPGGVVNLITGRVAELAPVLAAHRDVDVLDLAGAPASLLADLERAAVTNVKRVLHPDASELDWTAAPMPLSHAGVSRDQDRVAPHRPVSGVAGQPLLPHLASLWHRDDRKYHVEPLRARIRGCR